MKMKYFLAALLLATSLASPAAVEARTHESGISPQASGIVGREVAAPTWSVACMTDHGPSQCDEPMWVYGSPGALAKYKDTTAAVADGYHMFLPGLKQQKVYHFTNNWRAMQESFRFDPTRPTSLLYRKDTTGKLILVGAMFTAPKRFGYERLDARVPLSIARWHKHVNWCLPKRGETARWSDRRDGAPLYGPESPIATKEACDQVGGRFMPTVFGWMLHANVFAGDDPATIWGDEHAGQDMHAGMKMDGM